eukprot:4370191-Amphidinium_carterae.2
MEAADNGLITANIASSNLVNSESRVAFLPFLFGSVAAGTCFIACRPSWSATAVELCKTVTKNLFHRAEAVEPVWSEAALWFSHS